MSGTAHAQFAEGLHFNLVANPLSGARAQLIRMNTLGGCVASLALDSGCARKKVAE